jgi:hypothetical protein
MSPKPSQETLDGNNPKNHTGQEHRNNMLTYYQAAITAEQLCTDTVLTVME